MSALGRLSRDPDRRVWRASSPAVGPALVGLIRPKVIIPTDFETRFDAREQVVILAHERAHLASGDLWFNALMLLVHCLNWFNPLIHICASCARIDQELACDAAVIARHPSERRTYAQALMKTQTAGASLPLGCAWPSRNRNVLKERVEMLALNSPSAARRLAGVGTVSILALAVGYGAWAAQPPVANVDPATVPAAQPRVGGPVTIQLAPSDPLTQATDAPRGVSLTNAGGVWDSGGVQITMLPKIPQEEMDQMRRDREGLRSRSPEATGGAVTSRIASRLATEYGLNAPDMLRTIPADKRVDWTSSLLAPDGTVKTVSFNTVYTTGLLSTLSPDETVASVAVTRIAEDGSILMDRVLVFDDQPMLATNIRIAPGQSAMIPMPTGDTLRVTPVVRPMNNLEVALADATANSPPPTVVTEQVEVYPGGPSVPRATLRLAPAVAAASAALRAQQLADNPVTAGQ